MIFCCMVAMPQPGTAFPCAPPSRSRVEFVRDPHALTSVEQQLRDEGRAEEGMEVIVRSRLFHPEYLAKLYLLRQYPSPGHACFDLPFVARMALTFAEDAALMRRGIDGCRYDLLPCDLYHPAFAAAIPRRCAMLDPDKPCVVRSAFRPGPACRALVELVDSFRDPAKPGRFIFTEERFVDLALRAFRIGWGRLGGALSN